MSEKNLSLVYLHFSIFLWGFTGIFGRVIELSAPVLVFYRLLITVFILSLIALYSKKVKRLQGISLYRSLYVGFCVLVHWILFYLAIKFSNASVGLSCIATVAVFTSFLEPIMMNKKFDSSNLLFAVCAVVGVYFIFHFQEFYRTGIILGLAAAFISSYFTILNAKLIKENNSETVTYYELSSALILCMIALPFYHYFIPEDNLLPDAKNSLLLVIFSIVCTVIPFNLSLKALKHVSAFTANLSVNMEPVYGIFFAILILKEQKELSWGFYFGTFLILASVVSYAIMVGRNYINKNIEKKISEMP